MNVVLVIIVVAIFVCDRTKRSGKLAISLGFLALCCIAAMKVFDQNDDWLRFFVGAELIFTFINLAQNETRTICWGRPSSPEQDCATPRYR